MNIHSLRRTGTLILVLSLPVLSGGCSSVKKFFNEPAPAEKKAEQSARSKSSSNSSHALLLEHSQLNDVERRELEKILPNEKDRRARQKEIFGF